MIEPRLGGCHCGMAEPSKHRESGKRGGARLAATVMVAQEPSLITTANAAAHHDGDEPDEIDAGGLRGLPHGPQVVHMAWGEKQCSMSTSCQGDVRSLRDDKAAGGHGHALPKPARYHCAGGVGGVDRRRGSFDYSKYPDLKGQWHAIGAPAGSI